MTTKPADVARTPTYEWSDLECEAMARVVLAAEAFMEAHRIYRTDTDMTFGVDRRQYKEMTTTLDALARALDGEA
jgi:hypothetical protein